MGNAYRWQISGGDVEFYFDHSHSNLIPMLSMPRNNQQLLEGLEGFLSKKATPYFRVGTDKRQEDMRRQDAQALELVKANPKVKFVLERFNGTIMQCQILDKEQH